MNRQKNNIMYTSTMIYMYIYIYFRFQSHILCILHTSTSITQWINPPYSHLSGFKKRYAKKTPFVCTLVVFKFGSAAHQFLLFATGLDWDVEDGMSQNAKLRVFLLRFLHEDHFQEVSSVTGASQFLS